MSKIICDICGTTYPETAECCPICGCSPDTKLTADDLLNEEMDSQNVRKKEIFDFDEVNAASEEADYEDEEEEAPRHNTILVILLTILIAGLLVAAGFIFFRYVLMNKTADAPAPEQTAAVAETLPVGTTEPAIPCETLVISSGTVAELNAEGQHFLLHVKPMPENTTDRIIYTSADESIATVTEDGRITAVSEGETKVFISCGKVSIECPVIIRYVEETVPPTTEAAVAQTTAPVETVPETTAAPAVKSDVTLKLKKTDIMLGVYYQFTLELDCDLEQNEVKWSSEHPHIATVDENGVVTAVKSGTTAITATYGDQSVSCMVRCG